MNLRSFALAASCALAASASAQEAMYTQAATMPSPGTFIFRQQFHAWRYGDRPDSDIERTIVYESSSMLSVGLDRGIALSVDVPLVYRSTRDESGDDEGNYGVEDIDILAKFLVYKNNTGGIDTFRAALLAGALVTSGDNSSFGSQTVNPEIGAVLTTVRGRHGFNVDAMYHFNTGGDSDDNLGGEGPSDAITANAAYVYRIAPERYKPDSTGAWYITAELNGLYETNSDFDIRLSPGLMYEGRVFGFEIMGQVPVIQQVDHRPELTWGIGIGFRFLF